MVCILIIFFSPQAKVYILLQTMVYCGKKISVNFPQPPTITWGQHIIGGNKYAETEGKGTGS
jgi:hypothetical protein